MIRQLTLHSDLREIFVKELLPYCLIAVSYVLVLLSYPMPPTPGGIEILMGVGIFAGCMLLLINANKLETCDRRWLAISMISGGVLIIYPCVHGILNGVEFSKMARDLFPMLFVVILVPLIVYSADRGIKGGATGLLLAAVLCVGAVSPVEFVIDMRAEYGSMSGLSDAFDTTYSSPANIQVPRAQARAQAQAQAQAQNTFSVRALHMFEPAVIFAAIYCGCLFFVAISRKRLIEAGICASVVGVAFYGLTALRLRAPVGLFVIAQMVFITYLAYQSKNRKRQLEIATLASLICLIGGVIFKDALAGLVLKQHLVGTNGKLEEWGAVIGIIGKDWSHLLMGIGWGNEFVPNYQPYPVRFTHSLFSFVLLKSGLLGFLLLVMVYARLIGRFLSRLRKTVLEHDQLAIILASTAVIIIGLTFQPTYKMLGFSVILAMLLAWPPNPSEGQAKG